MSQRRFIKFRSLGLSGLGAVAALAAMTSPVMAKSKLTPAIPMATAACPAPQLSQLLLPAGDANWYTGMLGDGTDNFTGQGWTLTGGARIITTTLADGHTGSVLDLPSGSSAVSPTVCVASVYPFGRMMVRDAVGTEGVSFAVSYVGTKTETKPKTTGQAQGSNSGWTLSEPFDLKPDNSAGWQQVHFILTAGGSTSDFQIYNLYLDPRVA